MNYKYLIHYTYLVKACMELLWFHAILHHSTVKQGITVNQLFNEELAKLPVILDSFLSLPQVVVGQGQWGATIVVG